MYGNQIILTIFARTINRSIEATGSTSSNAVFSDCFLTFFLFATTTIIMNQNINNAAKSTISC
jgi:hypothetical protein